MSVINLRKRHSIPFTQISNELLNDIEISLKAKGLYSFMYSKPDGWYFTVNSMAAQLKDGRESIMSALKELINAGYIERHKHADGKVTYEIFFEKNPKSENPIKGDTQSRKTPQWENPTVGKPDCINNKEPISNKDLVSNNPPNPPRGKRADFEEKKSHLLDMEFQRLINEARLFNRQKGKIINKEVDEAYDIFLGIHDRSTLLEDFKKQVREKGQYASNLVDFMAGYKKTNDNMTITDFVKYLIENFSGEKLPKVQIGDDIYSNVSISKKGKIYSLATIDDLPTVVQKEIIEKLYEEKEKVINGEKELFGTKHNKTHQQHKENATEAKIEPNTAKKIDTDKLFRRIA